ncbi:ATP-binding protein [Oceanithermus sp.]
MSLRLRIALGTASLAALAAGMHLLIGYASFARLIDDEIQRDLSLWTQAVASNLKIVDGRPRLLGEDWSWLDAGSSIGFRVRKGNVVYLEGGVLPNGNDEDKNWAWSHKNLGDGFVLDLAMYVGEYRRALLNQLRAGEVSLPLVIVLASLLGWWYAGRITRPVARLADAADQLSRMSFPDPVPPPPGNDELTRLAESFNRMVYSVREALERERSFTRYASHELRTPLATLQAQLETLEAGLTPAEKALPESRRALQRMRGILEGLLTLSREPRVTLEPLPADLLLRQFYESLPDDVKQRVNLKPSAGEVWVMADEELWRRAFGNLLDNALKHTSGKIELGVERRGGEVVFSVRDYGPGVSEEELERLTEPFVRFNSKVEGTGLGLSLSKQAAQAMRGRLEFVRKNPGLQASLVLPVLEVEDV